jgi:hypothetical protein
MVPEKAAPVAGTGIVHLMGRHNPGNHGGAGDCGSRTRAGSGTCRHLMDFYHAGVDVVAGGAAGIDPYVVQVYASPARCSGHQGPECDFGNLRVQVQRKRFSASCLSAGDPRAVPVVRLLCFHGVHRRSDCLDSPHAGAFEHHTGRREPEGETARIATPVTLIANPAFFPERFQFLLNSM